MERLRARLPHKKSLQRNLYARLAFLTSSVVLLSSVLASFIASELTRGRMSRNRGGLYAEFASQLAHELETALGERLNALRVLARADGSKSLGKNALRAQFDGLKHQYPEFAWIGSLDPEGIVRIATGGEREGQKRSLPDAEAVATVDATGAAIIELSVPLMGETERRRGGVLAARLSQSWLVDLQRAFTERFKESRPVEIYLLRADGTFLDAQPGNNASWATLPEVRAEMAKGRGWISVRDETDGHFLGFARVFPQSRFQGLDWTLVLRERSLNTFSSVSAVRTQTFLACMTIGGLCLLVLLLVGRRILQPLVQLTTTVKRMRLDPQGTQIPILSGSAEVEELSSTLHDLVASLREANASAERLVEQRTAELQAANDVALRAAASKSEFLANMSHEIRTPLAGILGMAEVLVDSSATAEQHRVAKVISDSGRSLLVIINDVLDLSKIEAGRLDLDIHPFDPATLAQDCVSLFDGSAEERRIALRSELDPHLPEAVAGDAVRIRQVLWNLVGNAVKFTETGYVSLRCAWDVESSSLIFEVRDTGIGLSQEQVAHLFQPFRQADGSTSRRFGGTGLGLSIARRLVELMGGRIDVQSALGVGSTFRVTLKLATVSVADLDREGRNFSNEAWKGQGGSPERPPPSLRGMRILVAEDNTTNQMVARMLLEPLGCLLSFASNGLEALEMHQRTPFHVILMDCQMPEMDGYEATEAIRRQERLNGGTARIIALTANAMPEDRERCLAAGMDDYVSKPFKREQLLQAILRRGTMVEATEFKLASIQRQQTHYGPEVMRDVAEIYLAESQQQVERIGAACASDDWRTLERTAHSLKSSSAVIGAAEMTELCRKIERAGAGADPRETLAALVQRLHACHADSVQILEKYLEETGKRSDGNAA